ncbi:uncharacterized protein LOC131009876 [Salvia miltiorrhiza]|uniref:uncharacterized protein LOC131009876 n=1 Tax=Salvia miltiorrhiza TaxID=226208 RepID=UPI0025AD3FA0|nr:uncharacterized protein LOC131009876 [Salvia miltiorrhiza]
MATCDNLLKRKVAIQQQGALCVFYKSTIETVDHIFFGCQKTLELWNATLSWIGKQMAMHCKVIDHFNAFINLGNKKDKRFLIGVWSGLFWCIWKLRNERKFQHGVWNSKRTEAELKSRLWSWMTMYNVQKVTEDFRRWFEAAL